MLAEFLADASACDARPRPPGELSELTPQNFAKACRQLLPILGRIDVETQQALERLCDRGAEIRRKDAEALAAALLLELRKARALVRRR
jgi:hypothetical protein